jgi:hypothetical protein
MNMGFDVNDKKTSEAQDATDYSPYSDKQYNNYINDINNGVYTNNSLTLVNLILGKFTIHRNLLRQATFLRFYQLLWYLDFRTVQQLWLLEHHLKRYVLSKATF